jgi:hypothetical protein
VSAEAIIAWATAVNVLVTAVYAFFTWGLWRVTSRTFAASHRPYVEIFSGHERVTAGAGTSHKFTFGFKNHGSVPARMVHWDLGIRQDGESRVDKHADAGVEDTVACAIFPGAAGVEVPALTELLPVTPGENLSVEAKVTYQGLDARSYTTLLRTVVIMTATAVQYFLVETVIDGE